MITKRTRRAAFAAVLGMGLAASAPAIADDPVVARVDGGMIRLSDVNEARHLLPPQMQGAPLVVVYDMLVESLINTRLAAVKARRLGLDKTPEFERRMARIGEQVLERMLLTQYIEQRLTEERIQNLYVQMNEKANSQDVEGLPNYDQARAALVSELSAELGQALMEDLRNEADIEKTPLKVLSVE